jgi:hypothetical protein
LSFVLLGSPVVRKRWYTSPIMRSEMSVYKEIMARGTPYARSRTTVQQRSGLTSFPVGIAEKDKKTLDRPQRYHQQSHSRRRVPGQQHGGAQPSTAKHSQAQPSTAKHSQAQPSRHPNSQKKTCQIHGRQGFLQTAVMHTERCCSQMQTISQEGLMLSIGALEVVTSLMVCYLHLHASLPSNASSASQ